jgi:hypothetical protein
VSERELGQRDDKNEWTHTVLPESSLFDISEPPLDIGVDVCEWVGGILLIVDGCMEGEGRADDVDDLVNLQ